MCLTVPENVCSSAAVFQAADIVVMNIQLVQTRMHPAKHEMSLLSEKLPINNT